MRQIQLAFLFSFVIVVTNCGTSEQNDPKVETSTQESSKPQLDTGQIEQIIGIKGTEHKGEYKVAIPQNDLFVTVDGFQIIPPMGLTSWATFTPTQEGAIVMGDLVVLEDEIYSVQKAIIESGLSATALHNHFVRDEPKVMFMHIHGIGSVEKLARGVRAALDKVKGLRTTKGLQVKLRTVQSTFAQKVIDDILQHSGSMNDGVYKVTIGRPDVDLKDHGVSVSTFMGFNTWMAFQGTAERAAVAGDFAMLEREVAPVISALVTHGIEVVAVHNHMVTESPRIFFLHFWAVGPVEKLARGLKAGLDQTGTPMVAGSQNWDFEDVAIGSLPDGWKVEATNPKEKGAEWSVQSDATASSGKQVLALTNTHDSRGQTFNLCWTDKAGFKDGKVEVKVKAGTGREDQGGGPVWRAQDRDNYYIARWNPLEDNFRLYYVKNGDRKMLASAKVSLPPDEWHTITIKHQGNRIEGYLNGEKLLEVEDTTFPDAGGVGLWTKADAATSFDDFKIY